MTSDHSVAHEETKPPAPKFQVVPELVSPMLGGMATCLLFYPLECIEARLQVSAGKISKPSLPMVVREMATQMGARAFYKGLTPALLGGTLNGGMYFGLYRYFNYKWQQSYKASAIGHMLSATGSGVICTVIFNPFWVLKIRLATTNEYRGIMHAARTIVHNEGFAGLWKGVGVSLFGVSEGAIQFMAYEQLRMHAGSSTMGILFAGGAARLIAGLTTYPYALLRSVLQAQNSPYTSLTDAVTKIYKQDGLGGFYRGIGPNLARSVPPSAFMFFLVEYLRKNLFGVHS